MFKRVYPLFSLLPSSFAADRRHLASSEWNKMASVVCNVMRPGAVLFWRRGCKSAVHCQFLAICYRPSVRPSVCRLSATLVHPTQAVVIFGNFSTAFGTLAIRWHRVILKADRKTARTRRPHFMRSCGRRGLCGRVETAHNADRPTAQTIL